MSADPPRSQAARRAAQDALVRVVHHYGTMPEFVLLGGLVPELLCEASSAVHAGTTDVDVQVNLEIAAGSVNAALLEAALMAAGFTDVAIASHLLRDYYRGDCTHAIVLSNDSDLRPAIELAIGDGHQFGVFSPMGTVSRDLARVASWAKPISPELVALCQMSEEVPVPGLSRTLSRPAAQ